MLVFAVITDDRESEYVVMLWSGRVSQLSTSANVLSKPEKRAAVSLPILSIQITFNNLLTIFGLEFSDSILRFSWELHCRPNCFTSNVHPKRHFERFAPFGLLLWRYMLLFPDRVVVDSFINRKFLSLETSLLNMVRLDIFTLLLLWCHCGVSLTPPPASRRIRISAITTTTTPSRTTGDRLTRWSAITSNDSESATTTTSRRKGAISMGLEELARELGGMGRAKLAWDCYSIGLDPAIFFDTEKSFHNEEEDSARIRKLFPGSRRNVSLGKHALEKLASLYDGYGGQLEGGVASLSHVSQSSDLTTKLLLKLSDGMEIETVIIPWKGVRSTLCMSTQVGCRQGTLWKSCCFETFYIAARVSWRLFVVDGLLWSQNIVFYIY